MLKLSRRCRLFRPLTYSSVQIAENNGEGYEVLIDGRKLRVPRTMEVLKIQSKDVAEIVGLEWAGQKYRDLTQIQKHTLYVTQLCYAQHELSQGMLVKFWKLIIAVFIIVRNLQLLERLQKKLTLFLKC